MARAPGLMLAAATSQRAHPPSLGASGLDREVILRAVCCSLVSDRNRAFGGLDGGGRGIRTPVTLSGKAVFKTACFNRSHIPPREQRLLRNDTTFPVSVLRGRNLPVPEALD
jgi:hypothetical protein